MDMALNFCVEHLNVITKREYVIGGLLGVISIGQFEDVRGWWRLMELALIQDPHDEYTTVQACREKVVFLDGRKGSAKNAAPI